MKTVESVNVRQGFWSVVLGLATVCSVVFSSVGAERLAAQPVATARTVLGAKLPKAAEEMVAEADADAARVLTEMEKRYRAFLGQCRLQERLKPFVGDLIGLMEKFQIGKDVVNNEASQKRIRALMRERILDDEKFCEVAASFAESFSKFLADQDAGILIALKVDKNIPAKEFTRSNFDVGQFRKEIAAAVDTSVAAAQADVGRFVANMVVSDVLTRLTKEVGKGFGVVPEDDNSVESQAIGFFLELIIGAAIDQATDPTDEIVRKLSDRLAAAESAILDGTVHKPGLFRSLRQLAAERTAARRSVLGAHFGK
jgi:hypothetical protein